MFKGGFNFDKVRRNFERFKTDIPLVAANTAQNYFVKTFTDQGFDGGSWKEVNRRIPGTSAYKYPKTRDLGRRTSPILVRTGRLRRAVSNSIKTATWDRIQLIVEAPGAKALNEGDDSINLDPRPFMKQSPILDKQIQAKIVKYMDKIWE